MVLWFLSLHSPLHSYSISPEKVGGLSTPKKVNKVKSNPKDADDPPSKDKDDDANLNDAGTSSVLPGTSGSSKEDIPAIPPAFTPSIKKTLEKSTLNPGQKPARLPSGIDVALLKGRLGGKNKVK
jgi:DNA-3-methyladenine glycosylase II